MLEVSPASVRASAADRAEVYRAVSRKMDRTPAQRRKFASDFNVLVCCGRSRPASRLLYRMVAPFAVRFRSFYDPGQRRGPDKRLIGMGISAPAMVLARRAQWSW